jgi:hypothetical protein
MSLQHPLKTIQSPGRCRLLPTVPMLYRNIKPLDGCKIQKKAMRNMCHENLKLTLLLNFLVTVQETMLLPDPLSRTDLKFLSFSEL